VTPVLNNCEQAEKLKAKAARYRVLAQSILDPNLMAEVRAFARELDAEASRLEQWRLR
jgi:hypothetical protein